MKMRRRAALGLLIAAGVGLSAQWLPAFRSQRVRHILPSATADSLSLSVSLQRPVPQLLLTVDGQPHSGRQTDSRGRFWSFEVDGLAPSTTYSLQLLAGDAVLEKTWPLRTFPAWDDRPDSLRLMAYTCAGGGNGFGFLGRQFFKPHAFRQKLFEEGLAQAPDAAIAIGDHIYFDLKGQAVPTAGKGLIKQVSGWYMALRYGAFDRSAPMLGTANETLLKTIGDEQIADLYGTRFKSVPVFFVSDDHDYFENDDANEDIVTFPPDSFSAKAHAAIAELYYPPLPHAPTAEVNRQFGILRYGSLFEAPLFDCAGKLWLSGEEGGLVPAETEAWIQQRITESDATHFALVPSHPVGWTAGKWREWYPDVVAPEGYTGVVTNQLMQEVTGELTTRASKYLWPLGWWQQHQRLLKALHGRAGSRFMLSGDIHAQGAVAITNSGDLSLEDRPLSSILAGPVSSSEATWPSAARGVGAASPGWLSTRALSDTREVNGFAMLYVDRDSTRVLLHDCGGNEPGVNVPELERQAEDGRVQRISELEIEA